MGRAIVAGAVEAAMRAMRAHPRHAEIQISGCRILWGLASTPMKQIVVKKFHNGDGATLVQTAMNAHANSRDIAAVGRQILIEPGHD